MIYVFIGVFCLLLVGVNTAVWAIVNSVDLDWRPGLVGLVISLLVMLGGYILGGLL